MVERCHSVQELHWCNKKIAHINTPSPQSMFYPPQNADVAPRGAEIFGAAAGAKDSFREGLENKVRKGNKMVGYGHVAPCAGRCAVSRQPDQARGSFFVRV
jgi:hypothetical protein